jgi:uncharacterized membrane protein YfcA
VGFGAGLMISVLTTPVGVSGAVFLLPVQLDLLAVPSPRVTPTNLLFNIVAVPGSLLRYHRQDQWDRRLIRRLLLGAVPGVILGAVVRVWLVPGAGIFRLLVAVLLGPLGLVVLLRRPRPAAPPAPWLTDGVLTVLAFAAGVIGGVYGIGGGSLLSPILAAGGLPLARVAPAALVSTLLTSLVGAGIYALLALTTDGPISPDWSLGLACGLGGLGGGYLGVRLQPHLPPIVLRLLLAGTALALAAGYVVRAV